MLKDLFNKVKYNIKVKRLENLIDTETILYYKLEEMELKGHDVYMYKMISYYNLDFYRYRYEELTGGKEYYTPKEKILKELN